MFKVTFFALAVMTASVFANQGEATWYHVGTGACGKNNVDSDLVVALNSNDYAGGSRCFQRINIWYNDKWTDATVVDLCPGCGHQGIDLSPAAFSRLASTKAGRINVGWAFA